MRRTALVVALLLPLAALAAPPGPPPGRGPGDEGARRERMERRMRMARTLGLAEALDLSEAEALKVREVLGGYDARCAPLRAQVRESGDVVRRAARGDPAAQKGLDEALQKVREARSQLLAIHDEMFQSVTKGFTPERKARAALFLQRFQQRQGAFGRDMQMRGGRGGGHGQGRGQGMGPGMGPGPGPRWGMSGAAADMADGPDVEILSDEELM